MIIAGIIKTKAVMSPFEFIKMARKYRPEMENAYQKLTDAKRRNLLLTDNERKEIVPLTELSFDETEEGNNLERVSPSLIEL